MLETTFCLLDLRLTPAPFFVAGPFSFLRFFAARAHDRNSNQAIKTQRRRSNRSLATKRNTSSHGTSRCYERC